MKYILCLLPFVFIFMVRCDKQEPVVPQPPDPIDTLPPAYGLAVLKDGEDWNTSATAHYYSGVPQRFRIACVRELPNSGSERLFLNDIPAAKGMYPIEYATATNQIKNYIPQAFLSVFVDDEQVAGDFYPDTIRQNHFIEITKFDTVAQTIKGRFQVFMGAVKIDPLWTNAPDSIFFTKGEFFLKVNK